MGPVIINGERVDLDGTPVYRPAPPSPASVAEQKAEAERQAELARHWPRSVEAAVADQLQRLDAASKDRLRSCRPDELCDLHFSWGLGIRNAYGLRGGNPELEASCGKSDPDDCSSVIMHAVWSALQRR